MSITITESKEAVPIAKVKGTETIIYFEQSPKIVLPTIPHKNIKMHTYICPFCKKTIQKKSDYINHVLHVCKQKTNELSNKYETLEEVIIIPRNEHAIIFVSGPPDSGKTYTINQYAKAYKRI
jgi:hypothetical protein